MRVYTYVMTLILGFFIGCVITTQMWIRYFPISIISRSSYEQMRERVGNEEGKRGERMVRERGKGK